jgi:hypothetical protein
VFISHIVSGTINVLFLGKKKNALQKALVMTDQFASIDDSPYYNMVNLSRVVCLMKERE